MHKHSNKFFIGAIVGSTLGAITTLLFSTTEGKKIQKKLMKKFHDMHDKNGALMHGLTKMKNKITRQIKKTVKRKRKKSR